MENILSLHWDLTEKTYRHSEYKAFNISDPKPRSIHKASVRDRLLHHALHRSLYLFFDRTFISHSYSCRINKGVHKALKTFRSFGYKVSRNEKETVWVLKCDIRKFFASIDHKILTEIIRENISDKDVLSLLSEIVGSFRSTEEGKGLPLGNLTSQLLVNIYMNRFDQFMKHKMKARYYIRYADDFVILSTDKDWLIELIPKIADFLEEHLKLNLHPDKLFLKTLASGVDFLGWVHFSDHRVLRTVTKRRMFRGVVLKEGKRETVQSYLGLLTHGNGKKLKAKVENMLGSEIYWIER